MNKIYYYYLQFYMCLIFYAKKAFFPRIQFQVREKIKRNKSLFLISIREVNKYNSL